MTSARSTPDQEEFLPFKYAVRSCKKCGRQDFGRQGMLCNWCGERYLWSAPVKEDQENANV